MMISKYDHDQDSQPHGNCPGCPVYTFAGFSALKDPKPS